MDIEVSPNGLLFIDSTATNIFVPVCISRVDVLSISPE